MKPNILIADDEANILNLLTVMFKSLPANVIPAENGEEALLKAAEFKPDLIITDVVMPKKNGFEVCRGVRNNPEITNTPIIIVSALGDEYNKITGFEEGADDYVTKPFNIEELKARSKTLLQRHQARREEVKVPVQSGEEPVVVADSIEFIPSGIPELDDCLYGGIPKGSNLLLMGPLGCGKSTFARNFLMNGLLADEKCLHVAIDDDPKRIREKLSQTLPKKASEYEQEDVLRFVDAFSWSSMTVPEDEPFSVQGSLELNQLSGVIADASYELGQTIQSKFGGRRVVDSVSSLFVNFDLPEAQRFLSQVARTAIAFGGVTTLFLLESGSVSEQVVNNIQYIMDGVIEFKKEDQTRIAQVTSMKWSRYKSQPVALPFNE